MKFTVACMYIPGVLELRPISGPGGSPVSPQALLQSPQDGHFSVALQLFE